MVQHYIQVVYVSSAPHPFKRDELLLLVEKAQSFNAASGITGMLLHKRGDFMQVLEGPESVVRTLMSKIAQDPRHSGVLTLLDRTVDARHFRIGQWAFVTQTRYRERMSNCSRPTSLRRLRATPIARTRQRR